MEDKEKELNDYFDKLVSLFKERGVKTEISRTKVFHTKLVDKETARIGLFDHKVNIVFGIDCYTNLHALNEFGMGISFDPIRKSGNDFNNTVENLIVDRVENDEKFSVNVEQVKGVVRKEFVGNIRLVVSYDTPLPKAEELVEKILLAAEEYERLYKGSGEISNSLNLEFKKAEEFINNL